MQNIILSVTREEVETLSLLVNAARETGLGEDGHVHGLEQLAVKLAVVGEPD